MKKQGHVNCKCEICENGLESFQKKEAEMLERVGHTIRYVVDEYDCDLTGNAYPSIYTHGLLQNYKHVELECVLPIDQQSAMFLLNTLAAKVKEGVSFETYEVYQIPELNNVPFYFIPSVQYGSETPVLRVILADANNKLPNDEGCHPIYAIQECIGENQVSGLIEEFWLRDGAVVQ